MVTGRVGFATTEGLPLKLLELLEGLPLPMQLFNPMGISLGVNAAFRASFPEKVEHENGKEIFGDVFAKALVGEASSPIHGDFAGWPVELCLRPLMSKAGQVSHILACFQDRRKEVGDTDRRQLEAQMMARDRVASIGRLAGGIAHEINNPLLAVVANLQFAQEEVTSLVTRGLASSSLAEAFEGIRVATDRVRRIVRDVNVFSHRGGPDALVAVDLCEVVRSALRMARPEMVQRAQVVEEMGDLPAVRGSESRLGQVFLNLIVNAAQAITPGHPADNHVRIVARQVGAEVLVEITDSGRGIPELEQKNVFTPFFTTKPEGEGAGLGLPICQEIVASLGGRITFQSKAGQGSTFAVWLRVHQGGYSPVTPTPIPLVVAGAPIGPAPAEPTDNGSFRARVLVVDDDPGILRAVERLIGRDHEVLKVSDGGAALAVLTTDPGYDLILCDVMMPGMTGADLYRALRAKMPGLLPRMVFMTGGVFSEEMREFLASVETPRLEKPFDVAKLRSLLRQISRQNVGSTRS